MYQLPVYHAQQRCHETHYPVDMTMSRHQHMRRAALLCAAAAGTKPPAAVTDQYQPNFTLRS